MILASNERLLCHSGGSRKPVRAATALWQAPASAGVTVSVISHLTILYNQNFD
jgi:hypothetical protein